MSINKAIITGNLTRDAELRTTQSGGSVMTFSVAVNERVKNSSTGEWEDYANYINCSMFGKRAESLHQYMTKGTKVGVEGKLHWSSWEKDGQKHNKIEVRVDDVELLGGRGGQSGASQQTTNSAAYSAPKTPVVNADASVYDEDVPF